MNMNPGHFTTYKPLSPVLRTQTTSLPELAINAIYDHFGKPGPVCMMVEMTNSKILLDDIADL